MPGSVSPWTNEVSPKATRSSSCNSANQVPGRADLVRVSDGDCGDVRGASGKQTGKGGANFVGATDDCDIDWVRRALSVQHRPIRRDAAVAGDGRTEPFASVRCIVGDADRQTHHNPRIRTTS